MKACTGLIALICGWAVIGPVQAGAAGTSADAEKLLKAFLKPGANHKALSKALEPTDADFDAVFKPAFAKKAKALYRPAWKAGAIVVAPRAGQTGLFLVHTTSEELKAWKGTAARELPGGYKKVKDQFQDGLTIYRFKFVRPGARIGQAYDGLIHVNGQWRLFPKPYRVR